MPAAMGAGVMVLPVAAAAAAAALSRRQRGLRAGKLPRLRRSRRRGGVVDVTSIATAEAERSPLLQEQLMLQAAKVALGSQLQRVSDYPEVASEVAARLEQLEDALHKLSRKKVENTKDSPSDDKSVEDEDRELLDEVERAARGLQVKTMLATAIEAEDYETAAALKAELDKLSAAASSDALSGAGEPERLFNLGDCVKTTSSDILGLVAGWDIQCCESSEWRKKHNITDEERHGLFYILLINNSMDGQIAYVPETRLKMCNDPTASPINHPLSYGFFLGVRSNGTFIPSKTLRDYYRVERVDDPIGSELPDEEDEGDDGK